MSRLSSFQWTVRAKWLRAAAAYLDGQGKQTNQDDEDALREVVETLEETARKSERIAETAREEGR